MNKLVAALEREQHIVYTENGARAYDSTGSKVYDLFAMAGALRTAPEERIREMVKAAFEEAPNLALKCIFYLRDIRGGQGERCFFRIAMKTLVNSYSRYKEVFTNLLYFIPEYGRWDDLYAFVGTCLEDRAFNLMYNQLTTDFYSQSPSLLAKWLKSENASSKESRELAKITMRYFNMPPRTYRRVLSVIRKRINVLERQMSEGKWSEIDYSKIPSLAGIRYSRAFVRNDGTRYRTFMDDKKNKVNAGALYPYDVVHYALKKCDGKTAANKYWDNLTNYFKDKTFNGIAVIDTSASMGGRPIEVALSLGYYCAERAKGPFHNRMITFSRRPKYINFKDYGDNFFDVVREIFRLNICEDTNLEGTFDLILNTAKNYNLAQEDLPEYIVVISDMEFNMGVAGNRGPDTLMESIRAKWTKAGYKMPKLVYWNVNSHQENIPELNQEVSLISGFSPVGYDMILSGKTGIDLMFDKLLSERYAPIKLV